MNKKLYFAPETEELEIEIAGMLCVSNDLTDIDDETGEAPQSDKEI